MAIPKGHRFEVPFEVAFPQGAAMVGDVMPDNEFQSREDMGRGKPVMQRKDELTGLRQWKATVTDLAPANAKRASFEVILLAEHQPVPTTQEVMPGMRPVEFEGLTAEPKLAGNGEYKYQSYAFRATGFKAAGGPAMPKPSASAKSTGTPAASEQKAA